MWIARNCFMLPAGRTWAILRRWGPAKNKIKRRRERERGSQPACDWLEQWFSEKKHHNLISKTKYWVYWDWSWLPNKGLITGKNSATNWKLRAYKWVLDLKTSTVRLYVSRSLAVLNPLWMNLRRAENILKDASQHAHDLFQLLPSGKRYRSSKTRTNRPSSSFYPVVIRALNDT